MLGLEIHEPSPSTETLALMTTKLDLFTFRNPKKSNRDRSIYDHCHKSGHIKAKCWRLHGKPTDFQPSNRPQRDNKGIQVVIEESRSDPSFNKEKLEQLYQPWTSYQAASSPSSALAQKGPMLGEEDLQC